MLQNSSLRGSSGTHVVKGRLYRHESERYQIEHQVSSDCIDELTPDIMMRILHDTITFPIVEDAERLTI